MRSPLKMAVSFLTDQEIRFGYLNRMGFYNHLSDEQYIRRKSRVCLHYIPDLSHPKTYNEKLNWLKLHDHDPRYTKMVDKYEVKQYIAAKIGAQYVVPTLGVWDNFDQIDFDNLPDQFVLKCTHDSGGVVICPDKSQFDREAARQKLTANLGYNYYYDSREWPYKNINPRIMAEKYLIDSAYGELRDYKFYTFGGVVRAMMIVGDRYDKNKKTTYDYFDRDGNWLDFRFGGPNAKVHPDAPLHVKEMIVLAEQLSKDMVHVRVDFYDVDGRIYFGEMTFYDGGGTQPFEPDEWDRKFGDWLNLPDAKEEK